jgi:hypothetical protein
MQGSFGCPVSFPRLNHCWPIRPSHKVSTLDLQRAFEQVMPASLNYDGAQIVRLVL